MGEKTKVLLIRVSSSYFSGDYETPVYCATREGWVEVTDEELEYLWLGAVSMGYVVIIDKGDEVPAVIERGRQIEEKRIRGAEKRQEQAAAREATKKMSKKERELKEFERLKKMYADKGGK